jgi:hypothetical protein
MSEYDLPNLVHRIQQEGTSTDKLTDWWRGSLLGFLIGTESGAYYIVEPASGQPSLVTRLSEATPYHGEFRMTGSEPILRREGNPDTELQIGKCVDIVGLSRKGVDFDPDSLYTTTPVVEIKYLESGDG